MPTLAYRFVDVLVGSEDWTYVNVYLHEYPIIKTTVKGFWIDMFGRKRFVLSDSRKKFACLTKEDALESFKRRKERQIRLLESQLSHAKTALDKAHTMEAKEVHQ